MTTKEFFQLFWYAENWDLTLNLIFIGISVIYLLATGPFVSKIPGAEVVPVRQKVFFLFAMIIYYTALGSPINLLGHELFSMHMLQMSILFIVLPPFLLLGIPAWMIRPLFRFKALRAVGSFLTKPLVILFVFNGLISLYHIPVAFDAIMESHLYHNVSHFVLLLGALFMWWPVICPVPELDRVKPLHKLGFIFANGILLTPVCALVMFADRPLFELYQEMSTVAPIMPPIDDQQLGGVIMKIVQEIVYISAIGIVLVRWMREQRQQDEQETQEWKETQQKVVSV
ncbi:cytochrome c oxidase assembly protein [Risungbinella massiliensis]|uniref:cytochrome c oxidase assembly protein n=1 Tax=Risungbinella massiliensis TaxID=1329796 RepID=UPI0005CBA06C|nr:cytochrome c oxidase assembly protein [Risungbinella massiliensis]